MKIGSCPPLKILQGFCTIYGLESKLHNMTYKAHSDLPTCFSSYFLMCTSPPGILNEVYSASFIYYDLTCAEIYMMSPLSGICFPFPLSYCPCPLASFFLTHSSIFKLNISSSVKPSIPLLARQI